MTMVNLAGVIGTMHAWGMAGAYNPYDSFACTASTHKFAVVFHVPATGSIEKLYFRTGTVTTGDDIKGGLYTVDTSGNPTTSAYGSMVAGVVTVASSDDNVSKVVTLGTPATATAGDLVAAVFEYNSYVAGSMNFQAFSNSSSSAMQKPFVTHFTTAWNRQSIIPLLAVEYSSTTYYSIPGVLPFTAGIGTLSFASNSTPDEHAIKLSLPAPIRLMGLAGHIALASITASDFEIHVYDAASADFATAKTVPAESISFTNQRAVHLPAPIAVLAKATTYRISFKPTSTNQITVLYGDVPTANALAQVTGSAGALTYSSRVDAGAWDDSNTTRLLMYGLAFDQIDDGAGSGGATLARLPSGLGG